MIEVPVRVKDALRDGRMLKNYRFNVLNDDGTVDFTIDNDALVSESVKIDERMCTGNQLKFGLCEGSSLEFQYFDNPNITGRQIQAFIDVQYKDANGDLQWHSIPMGFFTVDQCPMQFSTGIRKVTAYNKLRSAYLDEKANDAIIEAVQTGIQGQTGQLSVGLILDSLLDGFTIYNAYQISEISMQNQNYSKNAYEEVDDEGVKTGNVLTFTMSSYRNFEIDDYSDDKIYRLQMNCKKVYEKFLSYIPSEYLDKKFVHPQTYPEPQPEPMTLRELVGEHDTYAFYYFELWARLYGDTGVGDSDIYVNRYGNSDKPYVTSKWITDLRASDELAINIPTMWKIIPSTQHSSTSNENDFTQEEKDEALRRFLEIINDEECFMLQETIEQGMDSIEFTTVEAEALPDVTLRDLQSAVFETSCQYGQLDRVTDLFRGVELNNSRLLPADTLYPNDSLYPNGDSIRANKSMYQKLWTDSQGVQSFRYLIITYKGLDENNQEVEKVLQRTVNADGTTDYNMSDNWLFKNLVWSDADVGTYADAMVLKMQNVTWFPFEMWCAGLPYIETGDELEISNSEGTYTSYVLQRQLNGIQNLQDTFIDGELDIF